MCLLIVEAHPQLGDSVVIDRKVHVDWEKASVLLAGIAAMLATACSAGAERNRSGDSPTESPTPSVTAASPAETSPTSEPDTSLVVLGDSNAHPTSCMGCTIFPEQVAAALGSALGSEVAVVNLAWQLSNPKAAEVADIRDYVRTNPTARGALAKADAVLIHVAQNDLAYNRLDDPCDVAPTYPRIQWDDLTQACMDAALAEYKKDLEALLDEIDGLREGRPTMLRIVTGINTAIGDLVDPTWNSPAAVEPSTYNVARMASLQCTLAAKHGGKCADIFHVLNGPSGRTSAQRFLNPADATHLAQQGHDKVAGVVVDLGFRPLVTGE